MAFNTFKKKYIYTTTGLQEEISITSSSKFGISIKASTDAIYTLKGRLYDAYSFDGVDYVAGELVELDVDNFSNIGGDRMLNVDSFGRLEVFAIDITSLGTDGQIIVDFVKIA